MIFKLEEYVSYKNKIKTRKKKEKANSIKMKNIEIKNTMILIISIIITL